MQMTEPCLWPRHIWVPREHCQLCWCCPGWRGRPWLRSSSRTLSCIPAPHTSLTNQKPVLWCFNQSEVKKFLSTNQEWEIFLSTNQSQALFCVHQSGASIHLTLPRSLPPPPLDTVSWSPQQWSVVETDWTGSTHPSQSSELRESCWRSLMQWQHSHSSYKHTSEILKTNIESMHLFMKVAPDGSLICSFTVQPAWQGE